MAQGRVRRAPVRPARRRGGLPDGPRPAGLTSGGAPAARRGAGGLEDAACALRREPAGGYHSGLGRAARAGTRAALGGHVHGIDGTLAFWHGPRIAPALELLWELAARTAR